MNSQHSFIDKLYIAIGKLYPKDIIMFNGEMNNAIFEVRVADIDGNNKEQLDKYRNDLDNAIKAVDKDFKYEILFNL